MRRVPGLRNRPRKWWLLRLGDAVQIRMKDKQDTQV